MCDKGDGITLVGDVFGRAGKGDGDLRKKPLLWSRFVGFAVELLVVDVRCRQGVLVSCLLGRLRGRTVAY